jgi:hypothetical protein
VTFKDLKKRVNLEITQQQSSLFERLQNKPSGYGILKNTSIRILELMEIAALIISLVYHRRMEMINHSMIMRK